MIDIIGILQTPGSYGPFDPETFIRPEITPPTLLPGWHVNTTPEYLAERPELEPFVVTPSTFRRVWSGDDPETPTQTVALRFADEAEALAAGIGIQPED